MKKKSDLRKQHFDELEEQFKEMYKINDDLNINEFSVDRYSLSPILN